MHGPKRIIIALKLTLMVLLSSKCLPLCLNACFDCGGYFDYHGVKGPQISDYTVVINVVLKLNLMTKL